MSETVVPKRSNRKWLKWLVLAAIVIILLSILGSSAVYTVSEGFVAAKYTFSKLDSIVTTAGMHLKIPFVQTVSMIDVREQSIAIEQNAYTRDTQTVEVLAVKINYRLNVAHLEQIIQETGVYDVFDKIIEPNVLSVTRNTIGQYAADALIEHRAEISQSIQDQLTGRFAENGVTLIAFTIQNIDFENSFEEAVRRKVEAEQKALEAQNQTREKEELGKQQVIQAQAEADAIKAKADAESYGIKARAEAEAFAVEIINRQLVGSPDYIQYLYVTQWNGQLPMVQGSDASPIIDLRDYQEASAARAAATPAPTVTPTPTPTATPEAKGD